MAAKTRKLNIEIGERIIKVCETAPHAKGYRILSHFLLTTPAGTVTDGQILAAEEVAGVLGAALSERGLSGCSVVFSVETGRIPSREVMLPPVKDERLKEIVAANAGDYMPVDLTNYHITYSLLERVKKGEDAGCRVLVYAAPVSLLEGYFRLAKLVGLSVAAIDYCGNSQYRALRDFDDEKVTMYVNVDTTNSYVTFMRAGKLLLQRTLSTGGDELIGDYLGAAGLGREHYIEAMEKLTDLAPAPAPAEKDAAKDAAAPEAGEAEAAVAVSALPASESLERLVSNISRTCDYFNSNNWETPVERLVLTGVCGRLENLRRLVEEGMQLPVSYLDELPAMHGFANEAAIASQFVSCIGSNIEPLDLIPPQFKPDKRRDRAKARAERKDSIVGGLVVCVVCLLAALALSGVALMNYFGARSEKAAMEEEISQLSYTEDIYNTYVSYESGVEQLGVLEGLARTPNAQLLAFLGELERKMPAEIILLSATCTPESISMNVVVSSKEAAALVLVQLRSFESLSSVTMSALSEAVNDAGLKAVSFSVNCEYGTNPYLAAEQN